MNGVQPARSASRQTGRRSRRSRTHSVAHRGSRLRTLPMGFPTLGEPCGDRHTAIELGHEKQGNISLECRRDPARTSRTAPRCRRLDRRVEGSITVAGSQERQQTLVHHPAADEHTRGARRHLPLHRCSPTGSRRVVNRAGSLHDEAARGPDHACSACDERPSASVLGSAGSNHG